MLLFFDIDGTIFDSKRRLPASVRPAMETAHRNGHQLFINTGRTFCNRESRLYDFPLDGWITGCGTRVTLLEETLHCMEYPPEASLQLRRIFLDLKIPAVFECDTAMYFDPETSSHPTVRMFRGFAEQRGLYREIAGNDPEFRAVKMFCFGDEKQIARLEEKTAEAGMPYVSISRWPEGWEVVPAGYSKATGIDILVEKTGARLEDCYAFGDSGNDLAMLRHAGHSIAMGNAPDDVKAACTYITDLPENDGIEKAMRHFGLI